MTDTSTSHSAGASSLTITKDCSGQSDSSADSPLAARVHALKLEPLTPADLWAAARACDCQATIHNNAEHGRGAEWEALGQKIRRVAEAAGYLRESEQ